MKVPQPKKILHTSFFYTCIVVYTSAIIVEKKIKGNGKNKKNKQVVPNCGNDNYAKRGKL